MKVLPAIAVGLIALTATGPAFSWGSTGHQLVGQTAYNNLAGTTAKGRVDALLKKGHAPSLAAAAEWPDCVRSVKVVAKPKRHLAYVPDQYTPAICVHFSNPKENPKGVAMMIDYAQRNWDQCDKPKSESRACHALYHFADIPVAAGRYDTKLPGAPDYDIVATIDACIKILKGEAVAKPFDQIKDYEALFLLAHLMGDLHQPLHVGAIYLDGATEKTPTTEADAERLSTQGGNKIFVGKAKLHAMWDGVDGAIPAVQLKVNKQAVDASALAGTPADWASESVKLAGEALHPANVSFAPGTGGVWTMTAPAKYNGDFVGPHQLSQVAKGGARLAAVLKQIWP